jgi:hypothetical protein
MFPRVLGYKRGIDLKRIKKMDGVKNHDSIVIS